MVGIGGQMVGLGGQMAINTVGLIPLAGTSVADIQRASRQDYM